MRNGAVKKEFSLRRCSLIPCSINRWKVAAEKEVNGLPCLALGLLPLMLLPPQSNGAQSQRMTNVRHFSVHVEGGQIQCCLTIHTPWNIYHGLSRSSLVSLLVLFYHITFSLAALMQITLHNTRAESKNCPSKHNLDVCRVCTRLGLVRWYCTSKPLLAGSLYFRISFTTSVISLLDSQWWSKIYLNYW